MAKRKTKKRKATYKKIGGVKVQTNPKFTRDADTELDTAVIRLLDEIRAGLERVMVQSQLRGIAIGRARATASGKKRVKR